jgi:hypothetical protein
MTRRKKYVKTDPVVELVEVHTDVREIESNLQKVLHIACRYFFILGQFFDYLYDLVGKGLFRNKIEYFDFWYGFNTKYYIEYMMDRN